MSVGLPDTKGALERILPLAAAVGLIPDRIVKSSLGGHVAYFPSTTTRRYAALCCYIGTAGNTYFAGYLRDPDTNERIEDWLHGKRGVEGFLKKIPPYIA